MPDIQDEAHKHEDTNKESKEPKEPKESEKKTKSEKSPNWVCCPHAKVRNWKYRIYTCELHSYNFQSGMK
jgi:hypothetical protein